jgi:heme/copper-type cytochrome/quinol oxidase subunit 2
LQTKIFWMCGVIFFAVQIQILLSLLRQRRLADTARSEAIHAEIIWTLVPAALVTAIALMAWQQGPLERAGDPPVTITVPSSLPTRGS